MDAQLDRKKKIYENFALIKLEITLNIIIEMNL